MPGVLTISLNNLRFYAYHGLYAEEKNIGTGFEVNLSVLYSPGTVIVNDIEATVNYVSLYDLVKREMQKPRELLETFLMEVTEHIYVAFPQVKKVEISATKLNPPIEKFVGTVAVKYEKEF